MLTTQEAVNKINALYHQQLADHYQRYQEILSDWQDWLENTYASDLPAGLSDRLYQEVYEMYHGDGLSEVASRYEDAAEHLRKTLAIAEASGWVRPSTS